MVADKVDYWAKEVGRCRDALRLAFKFVQEHAAITGGHTSDHSDVIETLEALQIRLNNVGAALRRLEGAN